MGGYLVFEGLKVGGRGGWEWARSGVFVYCLVFGSEVFCSCLGGYLWFVC